MRNPIVGFVFGLFVACFALAGCAVATLPFPPHLTDQGAAKTPVELQAIQTREFEADKARLISVFITVFQDQGYSIDNTDLATGFIAAKMPTEKKALTASEVFPESPFAKVNPDLVTNISLVSDRSISVLVSEISSNRTRARVTINSKLRLTGGPDFEMYDGIDSGASRYQFIFSRAQQGLFLKSNLE
jgi:hypothetical protein